MACPIIVDVRHINLRDLGSPVNGILSKAELEQLVKDILVKTMSSASVTVYRANVVVEAIQSNPRNRDLVVRIATSSGELWAKNAHVNAGRIREELLKSFPEATIIVTVEPIIAGWAWK